MNQDGSGSSATARVAITSAITPRPALRGSSRGLHSQGSFALLPLVRKVVVQWHLARPIWVVE
jgi:hypothetical protein